MIFPTTFTKLIPNFPQEKKEKKMVCACVLGEEVVSALGPDV
jgi:hypothetical protein